MGHRPFRMSLLAFAMVGAIACGSSTSTSSTPTGPLKIGVSIPLTGAFAALSKPALNGIQLWANQVNSKGGLLGRKVELTSVDNKSDADTGVTVYQNFLSQNMDFIIELGTSTLVERESTIAEQHKKLFLCALCFDPALFNRGYTYLFATNNGLTDSFSLGMSKLIASIPESSRPKSVAYVYANAPGPVSGYKSFKQYLEQAGLKTVMDTPYPLDINDATAIVAQIKRANADFVFVNGYTNDEVLITRALYQQGIHPKLMYMGATATALPNWLQLAGDGGLQVVYTAPWLPTAKFTGVQDFSKAYQTEFNAPPTYTSAHGYSAGLVLEAAAKGTKGFDQTKMRDWIKANTVKTVVGDLKLTKGYNVSDEGGLVVQVQGTANQIIWPASQQTGTLVFPRP